MYFPPKPRMKFLKNPFWQSVNRKQRIATHTKSIKDQNIFNVGVLTVHNTTLFSITISNLSSNVEMSCVFNYQLLTADKLKRSFKVNGEHKSIPIERVATLGSKVTQKRKVPKIIPIRSYMTCKLKIVFCKEINRK